tara:strand:- start:1747 stop:2661 length:915 start_codon:yes stop_codon:yes gene_type:complete
MKKYIVTGGAGFIGSHVTDALIKRGDKVIVIDNLSSGSADNVNKDATFVQGDIRQLVDIEGVFQNVDGIFHLAAMARVQPSIEDPGLFHDVNVTGTFNLLEMCVVHEIPRFIFSSSSSVYGEPTVMPMVEDLPTNPLSPYACNKLIGEDYCNMFSAVYKIGTVSLRYFNVYGDRMAVYGGQYRLAPGIFAQQLLEDQPITITGTGEQRRDFTHVDDVVNANLLAADSDLSGAVFNVGNADNRSVLDLAALFDSPHDYKFIPKVLEPFETLACNHKIKTELGWEPTGDIDKFIPDWIGRLRHDQV